MKTSIASCVSTVLSLLVGVLAIAAPLLYAGLGQSPLEEEEWLPPGVLALHSLLADSAAPECLASVLAEQQVEILHDGNATSMPSVRWPSGARSIAQPLSRCRVPVKLEQSAPQWRALERWGSAEYLTGALPLLKEAFLASSREAAQALAAAESLDDDASDDDDPVDSGVPARLPPLAGDPTGDVEGELPSSAFFNDADGADALYFARWLGFSELAPLRADVSPHAALLIDDSVAGGEASASAPESAGSTVAAVKPARAPLGGDDGSERRYFRLGSAGCTSTLHYDEYHNLFTQVTGAKRWFVLPPTALGGVLSHHKGHARYRQSPRRPVWQWDARERRALGVRSVVLTAGQQLYVPPYWWHQTLTLQRSSAVNIWSPSAESRLAERLQQLVPATTALGGAAGGAAAGGAAAGGAAGGRGGSKERALGALLRFGRSLARATAGGEQGEQGEQAGRALLATLHRAQHQHTRATKQATKDGGAAKVCAAAEAAALEPEAAAAADAAAARLGAALRTRLPAGVSQLVLADYLGDLAEYLATVVPPAWPPERGRATVMLCLGNRTV